MAARYPSLNKSYRAVVVHSSSHDRRRQKRIERQLKEEKQALSKGFKKKVSESVRLPARCAGGGKGLERPTRPLSRSEPRDRGAARVSLPITKVLLDFKSKSLIMMSV
jgi:hypothetical protein